MWIWGASFFLDISFSRSPTLAHTHTLSFSLPPSLSIYPSHTQIHTYDMPHKTEMCYIPDVHIIIVSMCGSNRLLVWLTRWKEDSMAGLHVFFHLPFLKLASVLPGSMLSNIPPRWDSLSVCENGHVLLFSLSQQSEGAIFLFFPPLLLVLDRVICHLFERGGTQRRVVAVAPQCLINFASHSSWVPFLRSSSKRTLPLPSRGHLEERLEPN